MKNIILVSLLAFIIFSFLHCDALKPGPDYSNLPALTEHGINVVVEIPAGTNKIINYNAVTNQLEPELEAGKPKLINFLPFPGNQGFIPSTISGADNEKDHHLKILLLAEQLKSGKVVEAIPVALMEYTDKEGSPRVQILAVPKEENQRTIKAERYEELLIQYDGLIGIIENWFLNYQGFNKNNNFSWKDEKYAMQVIRKNLVQ